MFGNPNTAHSPITPASADQGRVPGLHRRLDRHHRRRRGRLGEVDLEAQQRQDADRCGRRLSPRDDRRDGADAIGNESFVYYNYTRSLNDFADIEGSQISGKCSDGPGDPYPKIQNCPVLGYQESGLGLLAAEHERPRDRGALDHPAREGRRLSRVQGWRRLRRLDVQSGRRATPVASARSVARRHGDRRAGTWRLNGFYTIERNLTRRGGRGSELGDARPERDASARVVTRSARRAAR